MCEITIHLRQYPRITLRDTHYVFLSSILRYMSNLELLAACGIPEKKYYYRLRRLRETAADAMTKPAHSEACC